MRPLQSGDSVSVCRQRGYLPGDVVVVRGRGSWRVHRFLGYALGKRGVVVLTQADDAESPDAPSTASLVLGRADCQVTFADRLGAVGRYAAALARRVRA